MSQRFEFTYSGGRMSKTAAMQYDFIAKYHLSTEGYYFQYRFDKNNTSIIRATLYNMKRDVVDDVRVTEHSEFGIPHKSHHDVINHFEARLTLKVIG